MQKQDREDILKALSELGGRQFNEGNIEQQGTKLVIPEDWSLGRAIKTLQDFKEEQEAEQTYVHKTRYRYYDVLVAVKRVLKRLTGMSRGAMRVESFFGSFTPPTINIQTGPDTYENVVTGEFPVEIWAGLCAVRPTTTPEHGTVGVVSASAPAKYATAVEGFFRLIDEELATNSIYRGKAITATEVPEYLNLDGVDPDKIVYTDDALTQLNANVWSLIEHTDIMRANNLPLKRAVLLEGPYGTGKTLAAYLTAQRAVENGWTFIFVRPAKDDLLDAMATAQLYQPSVVFFEDIDTTQGESLSATELLDAFDGIQAKGTEIVAVLTTNHADRIHKGLIRPGRLDAIIHIGALDPPAVMRLIRACVAPNLLPDELDEEAIGAAMEGYMPAFVKEAIDRAVRYNIARHGRDPVQLTNQDFVDAANGLRTQLELMESAAEGTKPDPVSTAFRNLIFAELTSGRIAIDSGGIPLPIIGVQEPSKR